MRARQACLRGYYLQGEKGRTCSLARTIPHHVTSPTVASPLPGARAECVRGPGKVPLLAGGRGGLVAMAVGSRSHLHCWAVPHGDQEGPGRQ